MTGSFLFIDNSQANLTGSNNEVLLSQIDNSNSQKQLFAHVLQQKQKEDIFILIIATQTKQILLKEYDFFFIHC